MAEESRERWSATGLIVLVGLASAGVCWMAYRLPPPTTSDLEQIWVAARAWHGGSDPYTIVPTTGTHFPLLYPFPAVLVGLPLATLPFSWARVLWAAFSGMLM